ncbi:hypothetical protein CL689_03415 [Candidatus Saccharibacteria bacterium]|nr:hypothetical protein [Candidatus Saccharibacteria bacterium]|tara:strand:+ start:1646 stop:2254 length:609 start_codon:yes stop_codon:yes gene_type:complete
MDFKTKRQMPIGELSRPAGALDNPNFRRWFGESKIVDGNGQPLVVYHGTPDARFKEFAHDQFFTASKEYAQKFTTSSTASSSFYGISDAAPAVLTVYLRIENPFDTRNPAHRKIYNELFFGKFGNGAALTPSGLPDWVEARDLVAFLKEEMPAMRFDGIYVDEGCDDAGQRPMAYMPFEPWQIKSAEDNAGQFDPNNNDFRK